MGKNSPLRRRTFQDKAAVLSDAVTFSIVNLNSTTRIIASL